MDDTGPDRDTGTRPPGVQTNHSLLTTGSLVSWAAREGGTRTGLDKNQASLPAQRLGFQGAV